MTEQCGREVDLEKDYVSCLSITNSHTLRRSGTKAPALFRGGGGDGKRLARGDATPARLAARIDRQIRDLEDELGVCLLERTAKS